MRRSGENIRLTVQLIDTTTGAHVWSGVYQRQLGDVFALQQEVATEIVDQIYLAIADRVVPPETRGPLDDLMRASPPSNLEAYDLFLRGVEMVTSNRPALIEQSVAVFEQAIALDTDYADAWAGKGFALLTLGSNISGSSRIPASVYPDAISALRRALEIAPRHAFATGWLGLAVMVNNFQWAEGLRLMEQSLAWNPNDARMLALYGFYLDTMHLEGAEEALEQAYRLDPFSFETIVDRAIRLARQGRLLEAASLIETSLIRDRDGYGPNYFCAYFNLRVGRLATAKECFRRARQVAKPVDLNLDGLRWVLDNRIDGTPMPPFEEVWGRMQVEALHGAVLWPDWQDAEAIVAVYELAIEQRHPAVRTVLFGEKPPVMPVAVWRRFKEMTGVTQFQQSRGL